MQEAVSVLAPDSVLAAGPVPRPGEPADLFNPTDISMAGSTVIVVDNGNDRLLLMDTLLNVTAMLGRQGGGPGEYDGPFLARPYGDGIAVLDPGNARFTVLNADGSYRDVVPAQVSYMHFAVASNGAIYIPSRSRGEYLRRLERGEWVAFAARPDTGAVADSARYTSSELDPFVAVSAGDTIHVMDGSSGVLHKYSPSGAHVQSRSLPRPLADSLLGRSSEVAAQFQEGDRQVVAPFVKSFTLTRGGSLLLLIAGSADTCALLIDPHTYAVQRIVRPDDRPLWQPLRSAAGAWLAEPVLYVLSQESVYAYRLAERR
jgi:hypothetical protein